MIKARMLGPAMVTKEQWPTRMVPRETARSLMDQEGETADSGSKRVSAQEVRAVPGRNRIPRPKQEPELGAPVEIAKEICSSVEKSLINTKTANFTSVKQTV